MYCNKCGKQLPDDVCFCNDCGAQLNVPQMQVQPMTPKKPFGKMIAIVLAVLAVVAVVIFGATKFIGEKDVLSTPEAVIEQLGVAIEEADYEKFMDCFPEKMRPTIFAMYGDEMEREEIIASRLRYFSETFVGLEVVEICPVTSDEAVDILQGMESIGIHVTDMQYVYCSVVTCSEQELEQTDIECLTLKVDGKWYLCSIMEL